MLRKLIGRVLKLGTLISTWGLITTVLLQIFFRFSPLQTPSWTEEASRLFFIYAMSFAAGLAMKTSYYVHLDMFFNRLPYTWQQCIEQGYSHYQLHTFCYHGAIFRKAHSIGHSRKITELRF